MIERDRNYFNNQAHIMYKRLRLLFLFITFSVSFLKAQDSSLLQRPNVVLIVSHGHGSGDLGCYGNQVIKTPNLDKLAHDGIKFTNAYTTVSSGSASQSVILTGFYNHANGQYGQNSGNSHFSVFPEIKSLPGYLKEAGYRTARTGLFLLDENTISFDTLLGMGSNYRNTYEMAENCKLFISKLNNRPFFLYFNPADPSRNGETNEEATIYPANNFGNREEGYEGIIPTFYKPDNMTIPSYLPDSPECRKELSQYAQAVSRMDLGIGRLFELLKKTGQWENTLIVYTSDIGTAFPGVQNTLYEAGIKLPCIIKPPSDLYHPNGICKAMVSWVDLLPTILDFCKAMPSEYVFHGRSFKEIMIQEPTPGWDELYASHTFHEITMYYPMRMVMTRRYKLIRNIAWQLPFPISNELLNSSTWQSNLKSDNELFGKRSVKNLLQRPEYELYDIIVDPEETNNLAPNPDYASILLDLKVRLKSFQVRTNDPWVIF